VSHEKGTKTQKMLVELKEYSEVLERYRGGGHVFPLILAVLEGSQRGQVFVSDRSESAFVVGNFGFSCLIEADEVDESFERGLAELLAARGPVRSSYLLWYEPPPRWQTKLDASESVKKRERVRFEFRKEGANYINQTVSCPGGFQLQRMTPQLLTNAEKFGLGLESRFWSTTDDFIEHGLGVCLVKGDEVVSLCYGAAVAGALAEVDVVTDAEFRGQGLGTIVAQEFNRLCLQNGISPTWDCFDYNTGSMKLAERLGFVEVRRYPFYSFNIPL